MGAIIILLIVGIILLIMEIFLPGIVAGLAGLVCLIIGVVLGYTQFGLLTGNLILLGVGVTLLAGGFWWIKYFPDSRWASHLISSGTSGEIGTEQPRLVEQTGVTHSALRPSGTAIINGKKVDVITEGDLIPRGTPIKVVAVEGMRVVVRAVSPATPSTPQRT